MRDLAEDASRRVDALLDRVPSGARHSSTTSVDPNRLGSQIVLGDIRCHIHNI